MSDRHPIWVLIPVKETASAKSRLGSVVPPHLRQGLALAMLEDVLDAVAGVRNIAGLIVVTVDAAATVLAKEQGHVTCDDINDALADIRITPHDLDLLYSKLNSLEIEVVDQAEVDRAKPPEPEEEEQEKGRLDILKVHTRNIYSKMGVGNRTQAVTQAQKLNLL